MMMQVYATIKNIMYPKFLKSEECLKMVEAVRMFGQLEGILLDPVYTGKAAAGLIGLVRRGHFAKDGRVLFVHTGGAPSLFAYQSVLAG